MKTRLPLNLLFLPAVAIIMSGCGKSPVEPNVPDLPSKAPAITKIEPASALPGDEVSITGANFGKWADYVEVFFGAVEAETVSVSDKKIVVKVPPPPAELTSPAVKVEIIVGKFVSPKSDFSYTVPALDGCTWAGGFPGEEVVLSGSGFGAPKGGCKVFFGSAQAEVVEASAVRLIVKAPDASAETASVKVRNADYPVLCSAGLEYRYDADATALAKAGWTVKTHAGGAVCRKATVKIKLLEAEKTLDISVFEAPMRGKYELAVGMSHVQYVAATSAICANYGALAGLNASFFNMGGLGDCCDYVRIDGKEVVVGRGIAVQDAALNSAMVFNKKGEDVFFRSFYSPDGPAYNTNTLAAELKGENVLAAGPALMLKGKVATVPVSAHNGLNTARSAVGITPANGFMMVAVDYTGTTGITNYEHAELMRRLGCSEAMSLDGGGSTTLYYKDWGGSGVVNTPKDGGERKVCNVIYVKAK